MRFNYILAKLFSFELKNKNKINIRNYKYEPIKCNKNDKYSKVLLNPNRSTLVDSAGFGSIRSTLVLFNRICLLGPI